MTQLQAQAAAYARMSTDMQTHSIHHQMMAIAAYAQQNGLHVVGRFADEGRSGLTIDARPALRELLTQVLSGKASFGTVLVYDVSRWGRFQDIDESAHYEFMCRQAGVKVVYVAEAFPNDGSPMTSMIKGFKRIMAAEYSRELSAKVIAAQCSFARLGFKSHGGSAGYGFRRASKGATGGLRLLNPGERKPIITDRVTLVLGPREELEVVKKTYSLYLDDKLGDTAIAKYWNERAVLAEGGKLWNPYTVKGVLTNAKYAGVLLFNRSTSRMHTPRTATPVESWVRYPGAYPAIVSVQTFERAQRERQQRITMPTTEAITRRLRQLYDTSGRVTGKLIDADPSLPSAEYVTSLFGSLAGAYAAAGLAAERTARFALTRAGTSAIMDQLAPWIEQYSQAAGVACERVGRGQFVLNKTIRFRLNVACCRRELHALRWKTTLRGRIDNDFVLCARLNSTNDTVEYYYLFRVCDYVQDSIWFNAATPDEHTAVRFLSLGGVFGAADAIPHVGTSIRGITLPR